MLHQIRLLLPYFLYNKPMPCIGLTFSTLYQKKKKKIVEAVQALRRRSELLVNIQYETVLDNVVISTDL